MSLNIYGAKINVEFNDNLQTSPNLVSGEDIKTSFAKIHKRFTDMNNGAYRDIADAYYPTGDNSNKLATGSIIASAINTSVYPALSNAINYKQKNYLRVQNGTNGTASWCEVPVNLPAGTYEISFTNLTSTDTDASTCRIKFYDSTASYAEKSEYYYISRGSNVHLTVTLTGTADCFRINPSDTLINSSGDVLTFTGAMISDPSMYAVSNTFVPHIPQDTVFPTGDDTDRSTEILSMLNKYGSCHLVDGVYYVSGFEMPSGSSLIGVGKATQLRLLDSVSDGYCVRIHRYANVRNIYFKGGDDAPTGIFTAGTSVGTRHGIYLGANANGSGTTHSDSVINTVSNCWFEYFSGAGFFAENTGTGKFCGVIMSECTFRQCIVGIDMSYYTEYSRFNQCVIEQCNVACINNGGNNVFSNCAFHGVKGFVIDNSSGTMTNNAHGTCNGCTFNHINNMNTPPGGGLAVDIKNTSNGFVFNSCQLWYGNISVSSSSGIQFSDCLLGGEPPTITVTGEYGVWFSGCTFQNEPSISANIATKFDNCYNGVTGNQVNPNPALVSLVNNNQKNKLMFNEVVQGSFNGLKYTVNDDGSVTVSGTKTTASNTSYGYLYLDGSKMDIDSLCDGKHVLTGCPTGGGDLTYKLYVIKDNYACYDTGSGVILENTNKTGIYVVVWIAGGYALSDPITFYPMISTAADYAIDQTFVKYNWHEYVQDEGLVQVVDTGMKNYCQIANGSNPSGSSYIEIPVTVPAGKWIVSFSNVTSTDTDANWCRGRFHASNGDGVSSYFSVDRGNNIVAEVTTTGESAFMRINPSDTVAHSSGDTITVQDAMVCTPVSYKISPAFAPYVLSEDTSTKELVKLTNDSAKNVLYFDSVNSDGSMSVTHNGVTFTLNSDGTVTADGTASSTSNAFAFLRLSGTTVKIDDYCNGEYVLSGAPSGSSSSTYRMYVYSSGYTQSEYGGGLLLPDKGNATDIEVSCFIAKGVKVENIVFKPMICSKTDWDVSRQYVPYIPTQLSMYSDLSASLALSIDASNGETKNRLKMVNDDIYGYGIHVAFQDDGTIIVDGFNSNKQATNNFNLDIAFLRDLGLKDGEVYTLSDGLTTSSSSTYGLRVVDSSGYVKKLWDSYTNPNMAFSSTDPDLYKLRLFVKSGTVMDHVVFKPMLCTKLSYDESSKFVPFESPGSDVPSYYNIPVIVDKVRNNIKTTGNTGKTFMFVTDIHWGTNISKFCTNVPKVLRQLYKTDKRLDTCVFGGDYIDGGDHNTILSVMEECIIKHTSGNYKSYLLFGNHDKNTIYTSAVTPFTDAEFYGAVQAFNADNCVYGNYNYFYSDDTKTKTRMIFLDSGLIGDTLSSAQSSWLDSVLASTPSGWHIIAFWHMIYHIADGTTWETNPLDLRVTAFSTSVITKLDAHNSGNSGSKVEAIFGGHVHCDKNYTTSGGIPIVLTDTAGLGFLAEGGTGTKGTITETAFDIITVDYQNETIKCVRVGRGSDRTINY